MYKQLRFVLLLFFAASLFAVPPAPGISNKGMPKDSVKRIPRENELKAMGYSPAQIKKALSNALGIKKLAVIFVNFSDVKFTEAGGSGGSIATYISPAATSSTITTQTGLLKNLVDYVTEVSYGNMILEITPFTNGGTGYTIAANNEAFYGANNEANVVNAQLFKDAVSLAGSTVTNTNYDALMVVHAGIGEESSNDGSGQTISSYVWSVFVEWDTANGTANGFTEGETVPGKESGILSPFGVLCHEFGHQLGLPDLYQTVDPSNSRVGKWDLMDYGAWVNNGANPPHFSSWCKALINWITPVNQTSSSILTLNAFDSASGNCFKVPILSSSVEYFLFEYRRKAGFDSFLPGEGVLVWHIDDSVGSITTNDINNGTIFRVSIEEQDNDGDAGYGSHGEAGDTFSLTGQSFITPQSDSYTGGPSKITLSDFAGSGTAVMTAKLFSIPATTNIAFDKLFNYPNPVKGAASSTIRAVFSRNVTSAVLKLYTISGELVLENTLTQNDAVSSANNEWVYEYIWDLKNSSGSAVGSGIYVYVISAKVNAQTQTKTGKIAIIR
ncbi:MAG: hypothetical protein A2231_02130 [Candidatus Firestonebacteria bacterium RIFOXYA2_FULL_40_8]|nr:MAG: hypothetical protein A2231_02130 [Candidatus Firestonebacteria bacterium RIFOXYA2_FULL_40_8]